MSTAPKSRKSGAEESQAPEIRRLSTLLDVSQALSSTLNLKSAPPPDPRNPRPSPRRRARHRHAPAGLGELRVEASDGLEKPGAPVQYRVGEGITGRVVETARPVVVPRASSEPMLLHRASKRPELPEQELSFVCVPITLNRKAIGALSVDLQVQARPRLRPDGQVLRHRRVDDGAGDQDSAADRGGSPAARGREHASAAGAAGALRLLQHHRHQRPDAADVRAGGAGGRHQHDRADPRRVGHREGADRARDPLQLAARQEAVHQGQLRGAARHADRIGALRPREGRVHRRRGAQEGALRAGGGRHAVPRRDRRHQPQHPGQAAARPAGARVRAARRHRDDQGRTSGCSPPRTRTSRRPSPTAPSARTCTTG